MMSQAKGKCLPRLITKEIWSRKKFINLTNYKHQKQLRKKMRMLEGGMFLNFVIQMVDSPITFFFFFTLKGRNFFAPIVKFFQFYCINKLKMKPNHFQMNASIHIFFAQ